MFRAITRRDFIQGLAVGAAGSALSTGLLSSAHADSGRSGVAVETASKDYPPRLTGLRGSHPGSFEVAHALRDGATWPPGESADTAYDLVIVGAGISGLAAAHFYLAERPGARILLLDNHDDFGGHAKRNEFELNGQMRLLNGGTLAIESPRPYSPVADGVLKAIGIDAPRLSKRVMHPEVYERMGLRDAVFFDRETFGADHLAVGYQHRPILKFLKGAPLSVAARDDIRRIEEGDVDYWPALSSLEKKRRLMRLSYRDYLRDVVHADPQAIAFYQSRTKGEWGVGIDAVSALDCWGLNLPGFKGLKLAPGSIPGMGFTPAGYADTGGSVWLHFPDGNATIARGLVRRLMPHAVPGASIDDLVSARVAYDQLDRADARVRLRLNSTVIRVRLDGAPDTAQSAVVTYVRDGRAHTVRAGHCVLACYNMMIPYLLPELPDSQKEALHELVKTPLVYTSVAIRNWHAFAKLGVCDIMAPGGYHTSTRLSHTVDMADYRSPRHPDEPNLLWMTRTPCREGFTEHEQNKIGRAELMTTTFETFEREIRSQLGRMLKPGGFDPADDIMAITVNRWPHGYAPENNSLFDPDLPIDRQPHVLGRKRFGRIAIANSDAGGGAYTDVAIEQAHRAVADLLSA
jgi:spermidine dehydrogenase